MVVSLPPVASPDVAKAAPILFSIFFLIDTNSSKTLFKSVAITPKYTGDPAITPEAFKKNLL